ncbi:hypothetical protein F4861DRAFT_551869 [Xylaria intraflava]|nr:hypothetical protein F4861DRAFT_551869 [Xylaria intraflava]
MQSEVDELITLTERATILSRAGSPGDSDYTDDEDVYTKDSTESEHVEVDHLPWQPQPLRFYGPGPDGCKNETEKIGTLHYARFRRELTIEELKIGDDGLEADHEKGFPIYENGRMLPPNYSTNYQNQTQREVNYCHWELVTADSIKDAKTYPGKNGTLTDYDEYLLNVHDFNIPRRGYPVAPMLDNREDVPTAKVYGRGFELLKKLSRQGGHEEWQEGQPLGPDPNNPGALTTHIGWLPQRIRRPRAGLGSDPIDAVWARTFHGDLSAEPDDYVPTKSTWSENSEKVTVMTSASDAKNTFKIMSRRALIDSLTLPEVESTDAKDFW